MDIFTFPDGDENFLYAYIIMILVFIAASFTVSRLKRANKRLAEEESKRNEKEEQNSSHINNNKRK
ncbi:hypothetical protein QA612_02430 [Evansella sp. AB-P1]|uniref:hypothetical protein n=1 Tax=Evansella sp. AB-P1 TaxID=3037653 RepID=UPI00241E357E|nr:hypothetical protein [Evansella sp. AB-P1]MDG5786331.1 hypothetical protein [Evansella sp. AB-P1]